MAFKILDPKSNLSNQESPIKQIPLNLTRDLSQVWIYSNYPEALTSDCFGDVGLGNRFLNKASVGAGSHEIFYSYGDFVNKLGPFNFGIQVYNPNPVPILFRRVNYSHRDSAAYGGWAGVNGGIWGDYFNSEPETHVEVQPGGEHWFNEYEIPKGCIFSGNVRFSLDNEATITLYVFKNKTDIDGTATAYPEPEKIVQFSGTGEGFSYTAEPITLKASELTEGQYFITNYRDSHNGLLSINNVPSESDLIPLKLVGSDRLIVPPTGNLGNWAAHYHFTLNLDNDTNTEKTFSGFVKTDVWGDSDNWPVIRSADNWAYARINPTEFNSWQWLSHTVPANETYTGTFQFIQGTNGFHMVRHIFRII